MIVRSTAALLGSVLLASIFLVSPPARAGDGGKSDGSAKIFLHDIYDRYVGKNAKGLNLASNADIHRYFAPELAGQIIEDRTVAKKVGDIPMLDGDPFVDAQEWRIDKVDISVQQPAKDTALAAVSFNNRGQALTVRLELVKIAGAWHVREIISRGKKLSALFAKT